MRERTTIRERTLKELHSSSRFQFRAKFQISTCPNLNRRLSLDGSPVCVCHHFTVHDSSDVTHTHTHTHAVRVDAPIRSSSSVPPGRRGRAPASTRTKGSPARCRRIDARAGFDHRSRVHALTHSFVPNRIWIESAVSNTARTKLHWSRRYEGRDPIRRKKIRSDGDSRKPRTETSGKGASRRPIAREREGEGMHRTNASIIGRVVSISFENDDLD